jgi:ElaB/YqjD/DUF883 family membrane-anchored ribosome-binding protein
MDNQKSSDFQSSNASPRGGMQTADIRAKAGDAISKIADVAQQAGDEAKRSVSSLASEGYKGIQGLLNDQVTAGADLVSQVAESVQLAADNLDKTSPQMAVLVRSAAEKMEEFSEEIKGQSVEDLWRSATDLARARPALAFGAAAAVGFVLYRLATATSAAATTHTARNYSPAERGPSRQGSARYAG